MTSRVVSDRGGGFSVLSPPSQSPHHCGGPGLGSWITMGQTPPGWPSSIQAEDVETPAVKQKTHWNRDLQPSTCVWVLKVDHLLTLSLTSEKQPAHSSAEWKCLKLLLALNSKQNPTIQKKLDELELCCLIEQVFLFVSLDCSQPEVCVWLHGLTMATHFQGRVRVFRSRPSTHPTRWE